MTEPVEGVATLPPLVRLAEFGPLTIAYDDRVLSPRPWTVRQSAWAAELLSGLPEGPVLELCSGAGQIGLLAVAGTHRRLVLVDADPAACRYARINANHARPAHSVQVRRGPMQEALPPDERFPLILADPPWVRSTMTSLHPEDPIRAIDGGPDGLALVRVALRVIGRHLGPEGAALLQVGPDQVPAVEAHLERCRDLALRVVERRVCDRGALVRLARG